MWLNRPAQERDGGDAELKRELPCKQGCNIGGYLWSVLNQ